jgi:hypothetical protein
MTKSNESTAGSVSPFVAFCHSLEKPVSAWADQLKTPQPREVLNHQSRQ